VSAGEARMGVLNGCCVEDGEGGDKTRTRLHTDRMQEAGSWKREGKALSRYGLSVSERARAINRKSDVISNAWSTPAGGYEVMLMAACSEGK